VTVKDLVASQAGTGPQQAWFRVTLRRLIKTGLVCLLGLALGLLLPMCTVSFADSGTGSDGSLPVDGSVLEDGAMPDDGSPPEDSATALCGNGVVEPGEGCDDGNLVPGDGCDELCQEHCSTGSWTQDIDGAYVYTVPLGCYEIRVQLWGAGGGGGGDKTGGTSGGPGGDSDVDGTMFANGGAGGVSALGYAAGGTATGGDINLTGEDGGARDGSVGGAGGDGANSPGSGGLPDGGSAVAVGGGGAGGSGPASLDAASGGGGGGYAEKLVTVTPGQNVVVHVGQAGTAGSGEGPGGSGYDGRVEITFGDD